MAPSNKRLWTGRVVSALAGAFLLFDSVIKVMQAPTAVEATTRLGYPASVVAGLGIIELLFLIVYAIPRSSVFGAILLTGYLGGAVATHVRTGSPLFSHILFPVYVAALVWGGLFLRDERVRALVPLRAGSGSSTS
jgi:hypothetical protein